MQGDVGHPDLGLVEPAHALAQRVEALVAHGDAHEPCVVVDGGRAGADAGERLGHAGDVGSVLDVQLEHLAADAVLELVGRALGDHGADVDHRDAVGELVGLLQVLRGEQQRRALVPAARG